MEQCLHTFASTVALCHFQKADERLASFFRVEWVERRGDKAFMSGIIDQNGFRLNVGIILANKEGKLLLARRRKSHDAWQFPQGGIHPNESPYEAMQRELQEELGLTASDVAVVAESEEWLKYHLPKKYQRRGQKPLCVGQKQKWFLLRLISDEHRIRLDWSDEPEFDQWKWVDYWYPAEKVISFKQAVYQKVLEVFADKL